MDVEFVKKSDYAIAMVKAVRLDVGVAEDFKKQVMATISENSRLIIDLSEVPFIDSTGLGALLSILRRLAEHNGILKLSGLTEQVMTMFMLVRMNKVFDIYSTSEEAEYEWKKVQP